MTIAGFKKIVWDYYNKHGRHDLPWRKTRDPYRILVSEIMLQQTQALRVIPYFTAWLKLFPTVRTLARAPLAKVLKAWQGLGYNRRGLNLKRTAEKLESDFKGVVPRTTHELISLPGIGPYTAAAIQAFAFNIPSAVIETNIRTAFIHHFFPRSKKVSDRQLLPLIQAACNQTKAREWYSALMDYGAHLKQTAGNATRRSSTYAKQSAFKGSTREKRSKILKALIEQKQSVKALSRKTGLSHEDIRKHAAELVQEGFIKRAPGGLILSE